MEKTKTVMTRPAQMTDLDAVNSIIESCIMGWALPERVKRLVLGNYHYLQHDLDNFEIVVAELSDSEIAGVAAWEPGVHHVVLKDQQGMLLHGLYVAPQHQKRGIGSHLIDAALVAVDRKGLNGLLVKAQADALGFFQLRGFMNLPVENPGRDYPHRLWRPI